MTNATLEPVALGQTIENGSVRVHRWACYIEVTDISNAGRRGKQVRSFTVADRRDSQCGRTDWGRRVAMALADYETFGRARAFVADLAADYPEDIEIHDRVSRGVDVEPTGRFELRSAEGIRGSIGPHDFAIVHTVRHMATDGTTDFAQDTGYHPASKSDAVKFFAWAAANKHELHHATIDGLRYHWNRLGVRYDSH